MKSPDQVIKALRLTEKSTQLSANTGQYTFEVFDSADKISIKNAVERVFKVTVKRVNVMRTKPRVSRNMRTGKMGRTSGMKKAVVTLQEGDKIEIA